MKEKLSKSPRINYLLGQMSIFSYRDVINYLPYRYEDTNYTEERHLPDKARVVVLGKLISLPKVVKTRNITVVTFDFMTMKKTFFRVVAFNRPYLGKILDLENNFTLVGSFNKTRNEIDMINIYKGEIPLEERIKPIYRLPTDFQNYIFAKLVKKSFGELDSQIYNQIPYDFINKYRLGERKDALYKAHFPSSKEDVRQAYRHLKYEEALYFSLKNQLIREENKSLAKIKKEPIDLSICQKFIDTLPYSLTEDQKQAAEEIIEDMNQSSLMYRLLQGDVGTGKTLVSFIALYANYYRGDQGVLMAPTDALARQHYENAKKLFSPLKIKVAMLLGSTPASEKKELYNQIEEGDIDIIIGTHAVFTKSLKYSSLGLAIIDEQHRFGVNQRITLAGKGEHTDLLMMSATPIPRSLALTLYGDLDVSTLKVFPALKRNVTTSIVDSEDNEIYKKVKEALDNDKQIYIVAPLIDFREDERYSVEQLYSRYVLKFGNKVGLLHGKMKQNEKEEALLKFYSDETPILVTTPVIEVGIDVKKANTMVIYDASNFGLASLHQLRGRIGRDGSPSFCLLTTTDPDEEEINRLNVLVNSEDGFEISEQDLKLRGPGQLTGFRQSGLPDFHYLDITNDYKIFVTARDDARYILENRKEKKFSYIISRSLREIETNPLTKG